MVGFFLNFIIFFSFLRKSMPKSATSKKMKLPTGDSERFASTTISNFAYFYISFYSVCLYIFFNSVGRQILTKRPGADDDVSDADAEDITSLYKNPDAMSRHQKLGDGCFNSLFNSRDAA